MAQVVKSSDKREDLRNASCMHDKSANGADWMDGSVKGIIKAIQWPAPLHAVKSALGSMVVSAVIGTVLYVYGYAINQFIALFVS